MAELTYPLASPRDAGRSVETLGEYIACVVSERFGEALELRGGDPHFTVVKVSRRVDVQKLLEALLLWTGKDETFDKVDEFLRVNRYVFQGERHEVLTKHRTREIPVHEKRPEKSINPRDGAVQFQSLHGVPRVLDDLAQAVLRFLKLLVLL